MLKRTFVKLHCNQYIIILLYNTRAKNYKIDKILILFLHEPT